MSARLTITVLNGTATTLELTAQDATMAMNLSMENALWPHQSTHQERHPAITTIPTATPSTTMAATVRSAATALASTSTLVYASLSATNAKSGLAGKMEATAPAATEDTNCVMENA